MYVLVEFLTLKILNMAKVIKNSGQINGDPLIIQAEQFMEDYWGEASDERMFMLPFWQVSQMLSMSDLNQIALRVTNIDTPNSMTAKWVVFDSQLEETLVDPYELGICYYVFDGDFFNGPISINNDVVNGIRKVTNTPHNNVIRARVGRREIEEGLGIYEYHVFFLAAECLIINQGGGGGGILSGLKVPVS